VLGEAQFLWNGKKGDPGLDGKFKVGGWRHFGTFSDERFSPTRLSLADTASGSTPATLFGDYGIYSVIEQKSIVSATMTTAVSAFLGVCPTAHPIVTLSISTPMPALNSSV
jgi:hypothetical protein